MNPLRAIVRHTANGWWEGQLLDLDISADGPSEMEMVRELEHSIIAKYHLARKAGRTPFLDILLAVPTNVDRSWEADAQRPGAELKLPPEVAIALAAILHAPQTDGFALARMAA